MKDAIPEVLIRTGFSLPLFHVENAKGIVLREDVDLELQMECKYYTH